MKRYLVQALLIKFRNVYKTFWRRKWQLTLVFLPGKSYGQRSMAGYSPWGYRESDTTERLGVFNR